MQRAAISVLTVMSCLAMFFNSCSTTYYAGPPVKVIDSEEVTWIVSKVMARWKHRKYQRLRLEHSQTHYSTAITGLQLEISSMEILTIVEARNLIVDFVEELLREINSSPILSCQMNVYPFTANQLQIDINFASFHGIHIDPYYIGYLSLVEGMVRYYAFDTKDQMWQVWHSRAEPYTKAREISVLGRAADKFVDEERQLECPRHLDELFPLEPCPTDII